MTPNRPLPDPITVSVVQHRLVGIVDEMGEAMLRTSFSQILNSSRDFSTAITDAKGELVAQAEYIPVHVGAMPSSTLATLEAFGDDIHPGDVFLLNDPYHGGSHLPDLTACLPVFAGDRLLFWTLEPRPPLRHRRAPPTAPTTPPRPRSGRRACGCRRFASTTGGSSARTSCGCSG